MSVKRYFYTKRTPQGIVDYEQVTYSSCLILEMAESLGISFRQIHGTRVFELKYKDSTKYFKGQIPFQTHFIGFYLSNDKTFGKNSLIDQGLTVPEGFCITPKDTKEYWQEVYEALQKPLVVKPSNENQGRNVIMDIRDYETYEKAVTHCLAELEGDISSILVEEMFLGNEYRILATPDKVIGVMYRRPANVVGDGISTIETLIKQKNADPRRSEDPNDVLVTIKIDDHVLEFLTKQNLTLQSIPQNDERVFLRQNSNISTGGDSIDMTDEAHTSVKDLALQAMKAYPGLALGGIDFMTKDITAAQTPESYSIIEVNKSPGFSIHDFPYEGKNRQATLEFLYILFPELKADMEKNA